MSDWQTYNTTLTCIVDGTEYDIPVWNMNVSAGPYSRAFGDSVAARAFDGRYYSRHQGWRTRATLSWDYLTSGAQEVLREFIVAALDFGSFQAVFNPDSGTQIVEMVIEDANESLVAVFDGNNRFRSVSISFVSVNISGLAPSWITNPEIPLPFEYLYGIAGSGTDSSWVLRINRDEASLGSWSGEILITHAPGSGKSFRNLRVDESAGYIFVIVYDSIVDEAELRRYPLAGGSLYTSLWSGPPDYSIQGFDINRDDQVVYLNAYENGAFTDSYLIEVTYAGAATTLRTYTGVLIGGMMGCAYDRDGHIYYYTFDISVDDEFRRIDVDGSNDMLIGVVTQGLSVLRAQANAASGAYMSHDVNAVYSVPIPSGGSKATIQSSVSSLGIAVDWVDGMVYYCAGTGSGRTVHREPIAGGTQTAVATVATGTSFQDFDLGI